MLGNGRDDVAGEVRDDQAMMCLVMGEMMWLVN